MDAYERKRKLDKKINIMRIREINSRILTEEAKIINANTQLKELKSQLKKLKEDK